MTTEQQIAAALPDYDIGGELGRGGFGVVLAGRHRRLERDVAIKALPPFLADREDVRARFEVEARLMASLDHPHVVPVYDYIERDGLCVLVMEVLPGGTVWDRFSREGMNLETACAVALATLAGLHHAHGRGILHRDVKPENLVFSVDGVLKLTDFGIAKVLGGAETLATQKGDILGTPAYLAPEQALGTPLGPPVDVFAAGVMLYEMVSGMLPYESEGGALAIAYRHAYEDAIPLHHVAPHAPDALAQVIMRALAREPADRFPSAEAFGLALMQVMRASWGDAWSAAAGVRVIEPAWITAPVAPPAPPPPPPPAPPGPPAPRGAAPPSLPSPLIRPQETVRPRGANLAALAESELVPLREIIPVSRPAWPLLALAALAAVAMIGAGWLGLGAPARVLAPGGSTVIVEGSDVTRADGTDEAIELDLGEEVTVRVVPGPGTPGPQEVELSFSAAGIPLGSETEAVTGDTAEVDVSGSRYLVGAEVTATVAVRTGSTELAVYEFPVTGSQAPFLTVPGVATVVLTLAALSYAESLLRPLRRGRRGVGAVFALALAGAALGALTACLAWLAGSGEPTQTTLTACASLGALAGITAGLGARRAGKRRRFQRLLASAAS